MKTTIEISEPLLERAKKVARQENTTLRALVEKGLRLALKEHRSPRFHLKRASVGGRGLRPPYDEDSWDMIRDAVYTGRGGG